MDKMVPDPTPLLPPSIPEIQQQIEHLEAAHRAKGHPLTGRIIHLCHHLPVEITRMLPAPPPNEDAHDREVAAEHAHEPQPAEPTGRDGLGMGMTSPLTATAPSNPILPSLPLRGTAASFGAAQASGAGGVLSPPRTPEFKESESLTLSSTGRNPDVQWKLQARRGHTAMISGMRSLSSTHEQVVIAWTGDIMQQYENAPSPKVTQGPQAGEGPASGANGNGVVNGNGATENDSAPAPGTPPAVYLPELNQMERQDLEKQLQVFSAYEEEKEGRGKLSYVPVFVGQEEAKGHYEGYCKTTLWPLFHYLLWLDTPVSLPSPDPMWTAYKATNLLFAKRCAEIYQPGDLIIVHDYHLLLVPKMIRELVGQPSPGLSHAVAGGTLASGDAAVKKNIKGDDGHLGNVGGESRESGEIAIGMFVHTPWPSSEVFRCLPKRKDILDGMLGANHVCFQTYSYSRHFISTCIRVCGYESSPGGVEASGQVTAVGYCPIGVDVARVMSDRDRPGVKPKMDALRKLYEGKKIIVGREKLDVAKGVYNKLQAFDKFLQTYPEWRGKVVLIQVTTPALSESPNLERQVANLVSQINGTYGTLDFTPVHHFHQAIERDEYFGLLSVADLALITSLRDGMNTTSMEFILCQDNTAKSPLVLSEFMGTASSFGSALQINPHDLLGVANAINRGLIMSEQEKQQRHEELLTSVKSHTSHTWAKTIVKLLLENIGGEHTAHQTPALDKSALSTAYKGAKKRLMLFDYDGTLTPIVKVPSQAVPTERTRNAITKLAQDPNNVVYLISGRDGDFLEEHWGVVDNLGLSAEHGSFLRLPGSEDWFNMTEALDMSWFSEVEEIFRYYTERTTGSTIEVKKASITWHYRNSDPDFGEFQAKQCLDLLESNVAPRRPIEVLVGKKNIECRPLSIAKSEIVKRILYQNPDAEFVFCAGDDKTDEDMFRALRQVFPPGGLREGVPNHMSAPVAVTSVMDADEAAKLEDAELKLKPEGVWAVAIGPPSKRTLAGWHVTSPEEVVDAVEALLK